MLQGVRRALEAADDIQVVGETSSGLEVVPLVRRTSPDVVLLDMRMPKLDGLGCLDRLGEQGPQGKVVILSMFNESECIDRALERGAVGYIVKSVNPFDLPSAVRQAFAGTVYNRLRRPGDEERAMNVGARLTARELGILKAVARGLSNHQISGEVWVTEQ